MNRRLVARAPWIGNGLGLAVLAASLAGCALETPRTDSHIGSAVRLMQISQTHDLNARTNPPEAPIQHGDGQRIERVIQVYRTDIGRRAPEAGTGVTITVSP